MLIGASLQPSDDTPELVGQVAPELEGPVVPQSQEVIAAEEKAALDPSAPPIAGPKRFAPAGPTETEYQKIHPELSWLLVREAQKLGITPFKQELSRKQMKAAKMKRPAKFGWLVSLGSLLSISLIIGGLNVTGILAFDHPEVGPELPFGNATSSLVAIVPGSEPAAGDLAMATIENERNLVRVDAVSGDTFSIATMAGSMDVGMDSIDGNLRANGEFIHHIVTQIQPTVTKAFASGKQNIDEVTKVHIHDTVDQILRRSKVIREAVETGKLGVVGANYKLALGEIHPITTVGTVE